MQEKEELEQLEEGKGANKFFGNGLDEVDYDYGVTATDGVGRANAKDQAFVFDSKAATQFLSDTAKPPHPTAPHAKCVHALLCQVLHFFDVRSWLQVQERPGSCSSLLWL